MSGSVVVSAKSSKQGKAQPKKKQKAKAASKKNVGSQVDGSSASLPAEQGVQDATVPVAFGVRNKLWVDDVFKSIGHSLGSLCKLPKFANMDPSFLPQIEKELLRLALQFCLKGKVTLLTGKTPKTFAKWSMLRPALQAYAGMLLRDKAWHERSM